MVCSRTKYFNIFLESFKAKPRTFLQFISPCLNIFEVVNVEAVNLKNNKEH